MANDNIPVQLMIAIKPITFQAKPVAAAEDPVTNIPSFLKK
jgi:hypothetical protein